MDPTRHLLLRDRRDWLGNRSGLAVDRDGMLALARVPAPADGKPITVATTYPYTRVVSGIAPGPCDAVFVSDTAGNRVLYVDGLCAARAWLDGFDAPRGLALTALALLVADSGHGRVQHLALPALEASLQWSAWTRPASIAVDSKGRILVVDAASQRLQRVDDNGLPDAAFDAAIAASGRLTTPLFVAVGDADSIVVSDAGTNQVVVFDEQAAFVRMLAGPAGWLPGAIAATGSRVYVADAATGALLAFDASGVLEGRIPGYSGPVTAMAADAAGNLYVKPGLDAEYFVLEADGAYVAQGTLEAGPYDAGETREWEWVRIDRTLPVATYCTLLVAQLATLSPPAAGDWQPLPSADALLASLLPNAAAGARRYLWLRVILATDDPAVSPAVSQAHAATPGENYLEHLPLTYGRNDQRPDGREGFLSRLLKLVRGEWRDIEELLDDMPRIADAGFLEASELAWLAQWLALELPQIASDDERRELIAHAMALLARRGTPESIARFVELHTGIRPAIVEAFEDRRIWVLGACSRLDFETCLPALDPNGMVVPDAAVEPACCPGEIGRAVVGESGPLTAFQLGLALFSEDAYRFCVVVDAYRVRDESTLREIRRIVEREKPAHTAYGVELVTPDLRVGLQARIGIDAIVGGDPPPWTIASTLGLDTRLSALDGAARVGEATLGDETMRLT